MTGERQLDGGQLDGGQLDGGQLDGDEHQDHEPAAPGQPAAATLKRFRAGKRLSGWP